MIKTIDYDPKMGEAKDFERIKKTLDGKSLDEQRKYFYSAWSAPCFKTRYTGLYETDKPVIVREGVIVGAELSDGIILAGNGWTTDERSDNNGAGYKEYSEQVGFYFTTVPLDAKRCRYYEMENAYDFFESHSRIEEVVLDESVDEICAAVTKNVRYEGSLRHWLGIKGDKTKLMKEIHLYLDGDKDAETVCPIVPEGVTELPVAAFYHCVGIREIVLPSTLRTVQKDAFFKCTGLRKIVFPDSVAYIGVNAFNGCAALESVRLPNSELVVADLAFYQCAALCRITIPASCKAIRNFVFQNCNENLAIRCEVPQEKTATWDEFWCVRKRLLGNENYFYDVEYVPSGE